MIKYLGVKIIYAEPMTAPEFSQQIRPLQYSGESQEGFKVEYEDGYVSWSPKDVFEKAYRPITGLTFGLVVEAAKKGKSFRLPHWKEDVKISLQVPDENSKMTHPYLYVTSRFGRVPWIPTMVEILAENWEVVE